MLVDSGSELDVDAVLSSGELAELPEEVFGVLGRVGVEAVGGEGLG